MQHLVSSSTKCYFVVIDDFHIFLIPSDPYFLTWKRIYNTFHSATSIKTPIDVTKYKGNFENSE